MKTKKKFLNKFVKNTSLKTKEKLVKNTANLTSLNKDLHYNQDECKNNIYTDI